nr:unnamed protein product [Spirometra erinaceieuropaei]
MDLFAAAAAAAAAACDNLGLLINTEKTVVMHQPPSEAVYVTPQLKIDSLLNRACSHLAVEHTVDIVGCVGRTAIRAGPLSR